MIHPPRWPDYARLLATGAIWGAAFLCIEIALRGFQPLQVASGRIALAALILCAVMWWRRLVLPRSPRIWAWLVLIGVLNSALPFYLIAWGQQSISSARSAILMAAGPFVTLALSHYTSADDRFSAAKLASLVLGFAGVAVLVGPQAWGGTGGLAGHLAVLAAAGCYAAAAVFSRHLDEVEPLVSSALVLATGALYLVPLSIWLSPWELSRVSGEPLLALLFLGAFPTALAYLLRFQIIRATGASFMSQVSYLVPLFALLWAWLFLSQVPDWPVWIALGLILAGLAASRWRRHSA